MTGSEEIRDDDFSERHDWEVDPSGIHRQLRKQHDEVYGNIMEPIQNALDSNDEGEPNTIEVRLGQNPSEPTLVVSDRGNYGITKDYKGDINKFMESLKATSEKINRGLARKGIGMFQYTEIAPKVVITSMDKEMIHRIPIYETPYGTTAYGRQVSKPIMEKYKVEFGISRPGTIDSFFGRDPELPKINAKKLIDVVKEKWALRLIDNPKIALIVEGKQIEPANNIVEHPPRHIQTMAGGHIVRGNLWLDPKGNGRIAIFQNGYLVEYIQFDTRQVSGYLECNKLGTNSARTTFDKNTKTWIDFRQRVMRELLKFPRISSDVQNEKAISKIRDMVQSILQLDKSPVAYGRKTDNTKTLTTGDKPGDDTVGYGVSDEEPDQDREKITREEHERNNEYVTRVGKNGKDLVKRASDEKGKRKKYTALDVDEHAHCGEERPLLILFENKDAPPPMLAINNDNAEYPIYEQTKGQPVVHNRKMIDWVSELDAERRGEIDEEIRIVLSKRRVIGWKKQDVYPKISIPARGTK